MREFFDKYENENHKLVIEHMAFQKRLDDLEAANGAVNAKGLNYSAPGRLTKGKQ